MLLGDLELFAFSEEPAESRETCSSAAEFEALVQRNLGANAGLHYASFARLVATMAACELRRLRGRLPPAQPCGAELPCHGACALPVLYRGISGGISAAAGKPCSAECSMDQTYCMQDTDVMGSGKGHSHAQASQRMLKRGPARSDPACTSPAHADGPHQEGQSQAEARLAAVALAGFKLRRAAWVLALLLADSDWGTCDGVRTGLDMQAGLDSRRGCACPEQLLRCPDDGLAHVCRQLVADIRTVLADVLAAVQAQERV